MKMSIKTIKEHMSNNLKKKGYSNEDIDFIIEMYLGGETGGHTSHGLADFTSFVLKDFSSLPKPEILKETNSIYMVDAKSNPGVLIGRIAADQAIKRATKEVIGVAMIKNMESWLRPGAIAKYIAEKGYLGIVINDGGGAAIAPPGGFDPTLGTNPIAYGIPMNDTPLVVDMATSKRAWGEVRLANKYGTDLPSDTFYNNRGQVTLDPKEAHSVLPFGDYKGYAIALLIEVLCGSLLGKAMMVASDAGSEFGAKFPDRGGIIIVIDPGQTVGLEVFKDQNSELVNRIKNTRPIDGQSIRVPGEQSAKLQKQAFESGEVELPDELWEEIKSI